MHSCSHRPTAGHIAAIILVGILALALFPYVVQLLWNGVLTDILPVKPLSYWQAFGLLALCKLLFGGFPGGKCGCRHHRCHGRDEEKATP